MCSKLNRIWYNTVKVGILIEVFKLSFNKDEAKKLIDNLPEQATWDDVMYQIYVKKKIDESIQYAKEGNTLLHEDVKKRLLKKWTLGGQT